MNHQMNLDLNRVQIITKVEDAETVVESILRIAKRCKSERDEKMVVALDCEGDSLGSNPASLIQVSVPAEYQLNDRKPAEIQNGFHHNNTNGVRYSDCVKSSNGNSSFIPNGYANCFKATESISNGQNGSATTVNDKTNTRLEHPDIYLFDVYCNSRLFAVLEPLLSSSDVIKVIHDCSQDLKALYQFNNIRMRNIFDTQIAHQVLLRQNGQNPYKIGINLLSETYNGPSVNQAKESLKERYRQAARTGKAYWNMRPLTDEHKYHAAHDVFVLVPNVYETMKKSFETDYWDLFQREIASFIQKFAPTPGPYDSRYQ